MKLRKKLLTLSLTLVLSALLLAVVLPVMAAPGAPDAAASLYKEANPPSGSVFWVGDTITYTVYITPSVSTIQLPLYFRDDLAPELEWKGFVSAPANFGWDAASRAITSTQLTTTTSPMSVTFTAEVRAFTETLNIKTDIVNAAWLCPEADPETMELCDQSNVVRHRPPYVIYLPLVTRNFSGATAR